MVGVAPDHRRRGLGRRLYETFFEAARAQGRSFVHCVTAPVNTTSIAFHEAMGFEIERVLDDYGCSGESRLLFAKRLA